MEVLHGHQISSFISVSCLLYQLFGNQERVGEEGEGRRGWYCCRTRIYYHKWRLWIRSDSDVRARSAASVSAQWWLISVAVGEKCDVDIVVLLIPYASLMFHAFTDIQRWYLIGQIVPRSFFIDVNMTTSKSMFTSDILIALWSPTDFCRCGFAEGHGTSTRCVTDWHLSKIAFDHQHVLGVLLSLLTYNVPSAEVIQGGNEQMHKTTTLFQVCHICRCGTIYF